MFDPAVLEAIRQHAIVCYPEECCGLVTRDGYQPFPNLHPEPTEYFRLPPEADAMVAAGEALAVVHSHPDGPDWPSAADQQQQLNQGIPWGICVVRPGRAETPYFFGDGIPEVPLMPRDFRWGPTGTDGRGDCLALVRDWYRLHRGIQLPDGPREPNWLAEAPTRYVDNAYKAGFRPIPIDDLRDGDLVFMAVQSGGRPNHAGIYLDGGNLLHHLEGRLARRESFLFWRPGAVMFLRPPESGEAR